MLNKDIPLPENMTGIPSVPSLCDFPGTFDIATGMKLALRW